MALASFIHTHTTYLVCTPPSRQARELAEGQKEGESSSVPALGAGLPTFRRPAHSCVFYRATGTHPARQ